MSNVLNWLELVRALQRRLEGSGPAVQFRAFASFLLDVPYVWGSENPDGTDCSGTVCFPLWLMGWNIRVTADVLYRQLFTRVVTNDQDMSRLMAVFYLTREARHHVDREVPAGTAIHVTPVVGHNVVLNAGTTVQLWTARAIREEREAKGCMAEWREINWEAAKRLSDSGKYAWDVDPVLTLIRGGQP